MSLYKTEKQSSRYRVQSIAIHDAFRGVFIEYITDHHFARVLQIGLRSTQRELDNLVKLVEEGVKHFLNEAWNDACRVGGQDALKLLLSKQLQDSFEFNAPRGFHTRSTKNAFIVDFPSTSFTTGAEPRNKAEGDKDPGFGNSWKIKSAMHEDEEEDDVMKRAQRMVKTYLPRHKTMQSSNFVDNLVMTTSRNAKADSSSSDDALDAILDELRATI